jgi:hypothetical protein
VPDFTNIFHTLGTKLGIKDSEKHLVLKYHGALHIYIQTEMEFLDISSLGATYRYAVKIEQKLKQKTWQFRPGNPSKQKLEKGGPKPLKKGQRKYVLAANSHFYTVLISCLHQCFANLDFRRNPGIKQHYYFAHLHTYLCSCFHDCKRENFDFEVILKLSLDCYDHSCLYVHCVSNLIMIIQLTRLQDSLLIWHFVVNMISIFIRL